ncbi:uncharacterized protein LOC121867723 [Homarus americanus]|uniref:XK-related protein n=1 Tax=Homarus americanus TaxID=6706 RepID=A0A8J5NAL1_HOMAM|nr:uncharacterized protein LOC121867723 [Homarus americanus]XP_042223714.1 uncharacterized protein LOC121867723 [Homarus americanus]XP_042223722.1 uncharacterized protein LOC121867723 [Homarus americanus]KAG7177021.1 putative XK-related domain-containing protein 2 [Homarus americanus]
MKTAPAPAGDPRPPPTPDPPTHPGTDPGGGAPPPTDTTTPDTTSTSGSGRWAAAVLLLTHIVELAAMVAATLAHALPPHLPPETTHSPPDATHTPPEATNTPPEAILTPGESGHASKEGVWGQAGLPLQVAMGGAPLVVITAISLVWAVRAQDFSGRTTARMLCWLLHVLQASILWRFLKVHLAFDPSDVAELGTLRFVQVHVHTLPFLVLHVTMMVGVGGCPGVVSILVAVVMIVSVVVTIIVATTASHSSRPSSLTPPTITQVAHNPIHGPSTEHSHDVAVRGVVAVTTSCVMWSRAVAVAALFCLHVTWASVLVIIHWLAALVWLSLQQELEPTTLGPVRKSLRRAFLAYLLLWDWHIFRDDASAMTVCARPRLPAAYYTITAIQNVAVIATWYTTGRTVLLVVRTAVLSSVLAAQAVALLLLALSYLYCSSLLPSWPRDKASAFARTASLVIPAAKSALPPATDTQERNSSYVDFKDIEEGEVPEVNKDKGDGEDANREVVTPLKNMPPMAHSTPRTPLPLAPRLMAAHLPPTMFSFSHDILPPRLAKSEHSSTDNGSFNSRNTNTLPAQLPPEYDLLQRAHGSFSDSFSSLSCGTINRATATVRPIVTHDPRAQRTPPSSAKLTFVSHSSCRNGFCHCKLFDGIEGPCDVNEEDEEERDEEENQQKKTIGDKGCKKEGSDGGACSDHPAQVISGPSSISLLPGSPEVMPATCESAPQVAVVRGIQRFRVVCAACLHAHDPLLTRCHTHTSPPEVLFTRCHTHTSPPEALLTSGCLGVPFVRCPTAGATLSRSCVGLGGGSSTDYPSDTEVTATADTLSSASADSHSTYTTWPVGRGPGMARLLQLHPGSHDYVTAWLRHQQARGPRVPPPPPPQVVHESSHSASPEPPTRHQRRPRHHLHRPSRHKDPPPPHLLQDLETVV